MALHFSMSAAQRTDLTQLLEAQQDRRSSQYHQFLTPEQFAERFGMDSGAIEKVSRWLESNGFHDLQVARGRTWIRFSGTVAQAETAFRTSMHRYSVGGEQYLANASDPVLPKALEGVAESVRGLHNIPLRPSIRAAHPQFTSSSSGSHYLTPDDWASIYDVKPLYTAGLDGTGVTVAIVGQSDVHMSDIQAFRAAAGLSASTPTVIVPPGDQDPGFQTASGDEAESTLDLEWAGGIAKNATILFITASSLSGNGVDDAMTYAIDNNVAPIVSESYGLCEAQETTSDFNTETSLFQQANVQGMTIVASSGDIGAAACDQGLTENAATMGLAVNFPASSPYVTGVGGTDFNEGSATYWNTTNSSAGGSAVSYIPEVVWNDGFQDASGGGASILVTTKPSWQSGTGVPADGVRDVPDVAFAASVDHDGYLICENGGCTNGFRNSMNNLSVIGGTSAGTPSFAGLLALVIQQKGVNTRLGNINPNLYSLAQISPNAFHDTTSGNNKQACANGTPNCPTGTGQIGFAAGTGYDLTTGWGSVDGYNFTQQWYGDFQISANPTTLTIQPGNSATTTVNLATVANFSGSVTFTCAVSSSLIGVTCTVPSAPLSAPGTATVTISASAGARSLPNFRATPQIRAPKHFPPWLPWTILFSLTLPLAWRKKNAVPGRPLLIAIAFGAVSCGGGGSTVTSTGGSTTTTAATLTLTCNVPAAVVGVAYSSSCTSSGGTSPLTYSISSGTLPAGLNFNASAGAITGTPTMMGTDAFSIRVTDSGSPVQTAVVAESSFVVSPASLTLSCTLAAATTGIAYQSGCSASGGTTPYAYAISAGALPAGLSLNSATGAVSGIPTVAGSYTATVTVTDGGTPAQTAQHALALTIAPAQPLSLTCTSLTTAQVGVSFRGACSTNGGTMPYAYSVSTGMLPPGLSINPASGVISGVPSSPATFAFSVTAKDSSSPAVAVTQAVSSFLVAARASETGTVTITATSGSIVSTTAIAVTVP